MKEIDEERLEHMFPDGYAITYIAPDGSTRFRAFNPIGDTRIKKTTRLWELVQNPQLICGIYP